MSETKYPKPLAYNKVAMAETIMYNMVRSGGSIHYASPVIVEKSCRMAECFFDEVQQRGWLVVEEEVK